MTPTLRLSSLVLLAASWMLAAGCGDDATQLVPGGSSGEAGARAHAGSSGNGAHAGATGGAGKAGSSAAGSSAAGGSEAGGSGTDTGGAAGEGGAPPSSGGTSGGGTSAGTGGTAGTSGGGTGGAGGATAGGGGATAGTGGTSGGGGATAGGGGATAGTGGTSGGGGATAGTGGGANSAVKNCAYSCATDDDCKMASEADQSHFCNPSSKRCEDLSVCDTSADCVAFVNQFSWYTPCAGDGDCSPGAEACVTVGRAGSCAPLPDAQASCLTGAPTQVARFGAAGNVQVCADAGVCVNKACHSMCECSGTTTTCNATTGLCDCSSSGQCKAASNSPVCGADSHCGCATSDHCAGTASQGLDHCYSGTCGCSGTAACPASPFVNAPPVCE